MNFFVNQSKNCHVDKEVEILLSQAYEPFHKQNVMKTFDEKKKTFW
jgi:hypothetical protein